jgi:hypothetical protein
MATVFRNVLSSGLGTTPTTVLTSSSSATTTVIGLSMTNITSSTILVSIQLQDTITSTTAYYINNVVIPANTSLRVINGGERLVLGASTYVIITSNNAASVDLVMSYVEIS